jgi:hypothetical protein
MLSNRGYQVEILDEKPMKQTHFALLRFKTKAIEEETGIKLEEVEIKKAIFFNGQIHNESNIKFDNLYSQKVTGKIQRRSIGNLGIGKRYIPPVDFFQQLEKKCEQLNVQFDIEEKITDFLLEFGNPKSPCISTLPMPKVRKLVHEEEIKFDFEKVYVVEFNIENCNVHQTIYFPSIKNNEEPAYRISVVGNNIKCEISEDSLKFFQGSYGDFENDADRLSKFIGRLRTQIYHGFGIDAWHTTNKPEIHEQKFGKISPINEQLRHSIIYNLTKQFGLYSLGRFSCWRQIMMDDVVKDVKKIENLLKLENLSGYEVARNMASKLIT